MASDFSHDEQVAVQPGKQPREFVLLARNVLKLVYLNVFEVFLPLFQHFRLRVEKIKGELYEIVEVEVIIFALVKSSKFIEIF